MLFYSVFRNKQVEIGGKNKYLITSVLLVFACF